MVTKTKSRKELKWTLLLTSVASIFDILFQIEI